MHKLILRKPTQVNWSDAPAHTNFADEQILGSTCGYLNGSGYLDERRLPGSNVLRHQLPPVRLRSSASAPGLRDPELQILSDMKALEGVCGPKGVRLVGRLRESVSREKVDVAFAEGDMKALRAAARSAHWGSRLHKDAQVQRVMAVISKYDKCVVECRNGLAQGDMIQLQLAMDHLGDLDALGLGPRKMENSILLSAKDALDKWAPYRPYLHKMERLQLAGPRPFAQYYLGLVEGNLLSAELEAGATKDLARFGEAGVAALEEVLLVPEFRWHYNVPWSQKNIMPQQVRGRLAFMGIDVTDLKFRLVRERTAQDWPEPDAPASIVVSGPCSALQAISDAVAGCSDEPRAGGHPAVPDTSEQRSQRAAAHRSRLEAARRALEDAEALPGGRANHSNGRLSQQPGRTQSTSRGSWQASSRSVFGKTF